MSRGKVYTLYVMLAFAFSCFFATSLINPNNAGTQKLDCIYRMILKSDYGRKNFKVLPICTQHCYGRYYYYVIQ